MLTSFWGFRKNSQRDKPFEDAFKIDIGRQIFAIADGVTRDRDAAGKYPKPSVARTAAEIVVRETTEAIASQLPVNQVDALDLLSRAFRQANKVLGKYSLELMDNKRFLGDQPGCVATVTLIVESVAVYGHIGDGALLHIDANNEIKRITTDQTAGVERWVRNHSTLDRDVQLLTIRKLFRNVGGQPESFGVLTGRPEALNFIEYGTVSLDAGDRLFLFTDGLSYAVEQAARGDIRSDLPLLVDLNEKNIQTFLSSAQRLAGMRQRHSDDMTFVGVEFMK